MHGKCMNHVTVCFFAQVLDKTPFYAEARPYLAARAARN